MGRRPDVSIDLRGNPCPLNWVKAKLRLEEMRPGMLLEVIVDDGRPAENVPRSAELEGHKVLQATTLGDRVSLLIERA